jgi:REP element-mobilizing transposase RayT
MLRRYGGGGRQQDEPAPYPPADARRYDRYRTHHRPRRLAGHDYAAPGWTFVTICTAGRQPSFGEVRHGVMGMSDAGCVAHAYWGAIPDHVAGVRLGAFVVMPNHVHGLIHRVPADPATTTDPVAALHATPLPAPQPPAGVNAVMSRLSPAAGSVSAIVRSYKSAVTRAVRPGLPAFAWQRRFHDHVVRDAADLRRIWAYIEANPAAWDHDRYDPSGRPSGR